MTHGNLQKKMDFSFLPWLLGLSFVLAACGGSKVKNPEILLEIPPDAGLYVLRGEIQENRLTLTLAARRLTGIHGIALRLSFDPRALGPAGFEPDPAWGAPHTASATREGVLIAGIAANPGGFSFDDTPVAWVHFRLLRRDIPVEIQFDAAHTGAVGSDGQRVSGLQFSGARLRPR